MSLPNVQVSDHKMTSVQTFNVQGEELVWIPEGIA